MPILILVNLVLCHQAVFAVPVCTANSQFKEIPNLAKKIAVFDEPDRKVDVQYAKAHNENVEVIRKRFAPTGDFHCGQGNDWFGGQLTIKDNVVTSSAHAFFNDDCTRRHADLSQCKFILIVDGKERSFEIEKIEGSGYLCNRIPFRAKDDWAVIRLKERVPPQIKPYRVDPRVTAAIQGKKVVAVGKSSDFYYQAGNKIIFPKHYADCIAKTTLTGPENGTIATNCDSAERTSGSSLLAGNVDDPILVGVHSGSSETHQQLEQAWKNHKPNQGKFDSLDWASYATPVSGEFYEFLSTM